MVKEELSKVGLAVDAKIHDNRIGITVCEVTKPLEYLHHLLPSWGLGFVELAHPHLFGILWVVLIGGVLT